MQSRHSAAGFSLIELMVGVAIMAILLGIAVPSFKEAGLSSQLRSLSSEILATANLARSEAIKRNAPVSLCVSSDGDNCTAGGWEQGWIVISGATVIKRISAAPAGFKINAAAVDTITFQPTGVGATAATLTVCRATPSVGHQERVVTIDAAGRAAIHRTTAGACA